jgi:hypothetical protein
MPLSSYEISAMVGQQQQMMVGQMQHASMISQQAGQQPIGEHLMGRATNLATGIGSPLLQGGMALAGADPFSMAIRGGMAGFEAGGIAGAAGGAMLGAGAIGLPLMAAQYAGTQMLQGGQQQQQLNAMLRQNYQQMGNNGPGFTSTGMGGIGQMLRQQTMQRGLGGEFASFEELGQLAGRMGQMGLGGQAARDAFEFNDKFKTMLGQVKDIAKALNTSLEEAQQVMSSMRGAGIFKNQGQIAQTIREVAMAGGMATNEITGMMNVGAQFSRMLGGRGSSGAAGGIATINQIGMAQQTGLLSEERLYDLTGMTGAEGRRALGMQRMQQASQFLRGGLGRRMIASMAGSNGTLDEDSVEAWQNGGMSTDETMGSAGRNLGRVGRANFIRNEGRLRGEVLGRFGGLAPIAAMSGWLEKRGMDPMSDRGQIFMSRRLGMSVEEVEQQLKEFRSLQLMENTKGDRTADANMRADLERMKAGKGISGIKKKFEDARNKVQNTLRQMGAEFYQSGSEMLEKWAAAVTGDFVMSMDRDVGQAIREASSGFGASSQKTWERRFGMGRGLLGQKRGEEILSGLGGQVNISDRTAFEAAGGGGRYREAGWAMGPSLSDAHLRAQLGVINDIRKAGAEGGAGRAYKDFGQKNRDALLAMAGMGQLKGGGTEFLSRFGDVLSRGNNNAISDAYGMATMEERARMARDILGGAGLGSVMNTAMRDPGGGEMFGAGGFRTVAERQDAKGGVLRGAGRTEAQAAFLNEDFLGNLGGGMGRSLGLKGTRGDAAEMLGKRGTQATLGGVAASMFWNPVGWAAGGLLAADAMGLGLSDKVGKWTRGMVEEQPGVGGLDAGTRRQAAAFSETERGRDLAMGAMSREPAERKAAMRDAMRRNMQLLNRAKGEESNLNSLERGELEFNKSVFVASTLSELEAKAEKRGTPITPEEERQLVDQLGRFGVKSLDDARSRADFVKTGVADKQRDARKAYIRERSKTSKQFMEGMRGGGMVEGGRLSAAALGKLSTGPMTEISLGGEDAERLGYSGGGGGTAKTSASALYASRMTEAARLEEEAANLPEGEAMAMMDKARTLRGAAISDMSKMSPKEMREMAKTLGGLGAAGVQMGREVKTIAGLEEKALRAGRGGDNARMAQQFGQMLGVSLSKEELRGLRGKGKGIDDIAALLGASSGLDATAQKELKEALAAAKKGEAGAGAKIRELQGTAAEAQREKRYQDAQRDDPGVRKMGEVKTAIDNLAKATLKVNVQNASDIGKTPKAEDQS